LGLVDVRPTWTTRPIRPDEADGSLEHRFVTDAEFDRLKNAGFFLDTVEMFGLPFRYGLPRSTDRTTEVVMLRAALVERFRPLDPNFVVFYVEAAPSRIRARLQARGVSATDVAARLADNETERRIGRAVADEIFVNDASIDALVAHVAAAIAR